MLAASVVLSASGRLPSGQCRSKAGSGSPRAWQEATPSRPASSVFSSGCTSSTTRAPARAKSEPERATVAAPRVGHATTRPAPFILLEAAAQIALREQRQRQIEMGVGIVLLQRDRLAETLRRLRIAVERLQRAATVVPGACVSRSGGERAIEGGDSLGVAVKLHQRVA